MKKQIFTVIIVLSASVSYGQSLVQFQNGTVADADDVNANFSSLKTEITANATATSDITSSPWESVGVDIFYTDGAVGIGTNTPNAILEVQGNTLFSNSGAVADDFVFQTTTDNDVNLRLKAAVGTGNESVWGITAASDTGEFGIRRIGLTSVNDFTINSSGNVGIGTNAPAEQLHLGAPEGSAAVIKMGTSAIGRNFKIVTRPGGPIMMFMMDNVDSTDIDNAIMSIRSTGEVGIGNSSPESPFAVSGLPTTPPDSSGNAGIVCATNDGNFWLDNDGVADCL